LVKTILFFVFLLTIANAATAQEGLHPLQYNPIQRYYHEHQRHNSQTQYRDVLQLPFIDDFSTSSVVPDSNKWIGTQVFINNTCAINPPSIGVATFDGLGGNGLPYDLTGSTTTFPPHSADTLTSQQIALGLYDSSDHVFLSFLYEPAGLC